MNSPIWIAAEDKAERVEREAGWSWVWGDSTENERPRQFIWNFGLQAPLADAKLLIAAQRGLPALWLDGRAVPVDADPMAGRELHHIPLGTLDAGPHRLAAEVRLFHPFLKEQVQGGVALLLSGLGPDGLVQHQAPQAASWLTSIEAAAGWQQPEASLADFSQAREVDIDWRPSPAHPARLLRRAFSLPAAVVAATLDITALGNYEAQINGCRVSHALLTPEASDQRVRVLQQRHDVLALLRTGDNVLGAMVADGFYASEAIGRGRYPFGAAPRRLWAELNITLADGSMQRIRTDEHWRASAAPVLFSEIYHGETHDARLEQPGWSTPAFDDSAWDPVQAAPEPPCERQLQQSPPIRATLTLRPRTITPLPNGDQVIDFGQNFAGWCRIHVRGEAGRMITLRFAELLADDGSVDMRNLRRARCTDRYILRGDAQGETWEPRFTYHGFRYVQLSGWPGAMGEGDIEGIVVHSDLPITGHFESSQPILQGLWRNTLWSQRSNFVGVPTDCPQRDERLGWTGDAQIFWPTAAYNMDVRGFTRRFLADLRASQQPGGAYMDTNPPALPAAGAPGWSDAGVVLPHTVWRHHGETVQIDEHWHSMERWMAWIADVNPDGLWRQRRQIDFGDWLSLDAKNLMDETTPKLLTATACWGRMLQMMAEMAEATGREGRAAYFAGWRLKVEQAFAAEFIRAGGRIGNESHTGYILPLAFGLVPAELKQASADHLAAAVRARGTLLTTGFLGTPFSLDVLADHGHADLAVDLLLRTEFPSWGYMVARGATTIWERWNGDTGDVAMNSFNHYALGAVTAFLYRRVAGIAALTPGFRQIICRPLLDERLGSGCARVDTDHGAIESAWGFEGGRPWFDLLVPAGCSAQVMLPERAMQAVQAIQPVQAGRHRFI